MNHESEGEKNKNKTDTCKQWERNQQQLGVGAERWFPMFSMLRLPWDEQINGEGKSLILVQTS